MLVFTTTLPLKEKVRFQEICDLIKTFLQGSAHYNLNIDDISFTGIEAVKNNCEILSKSEDNSLEYLHYRDENETNYYGFRLRYKENRETEWTLDAILSYQSSENATFAIDVDRSFGMKKKEDEEIHKPYLIKMLMTKDFCGKDKSIEVSDRYVNIKEMPSDLSFNIPLIVCQNKKTASAFAKKFSGMAHVFLCKKGDKNKIFLYENDQQSKPREYQFYDGCCETEIYKDLIDISRNQKSETIKYDDLKHKIVIENLRNTKNKTEEDLDKYIDTFDREVRDARKKISDLEEELKSKDSELYEAKQDRDYFKQQLENKKSENKNDEEVFHIGRGAEKEFYSGESKDIILHILHSYLTKGEFSGRSKDVVSSIIEANSCTEQWSDIRKTLNRFDKSNHQSGDLEKIGFKKKAGKKHNVMHYYGDERYTVSLPKTPSDSHSWENMKADIKKILGIK